MFHLLQDKVQCRAPVNMVMEPRTP